MVITCYNRPPLGREFTEAGASSPNRAATDIAYAIRWDKPNRSPRAHREPSEDRMASARPLTTIRWDFAHSFLYL